MTIHQMDWNILPGLLAETLAKIADDNAISVSSIRNTVQIRTWHQQFPNSAGPVKNNKIIVKQAFTTFYVLAFFVEYEDNNYGYMWCGGIWKKWDCSNYSWHQ